jgi:hypothetical protein
LTEKIDALITITNNYERLDIDAPITDKRAKEIQEMKNKRQKRKQQEKKNENKRQKKEQQEKDDK